MSNVTLSFKNVNSDLVTILLIAFLPVSLLMGSGVINTTVILIDIIFLVSLAINKNFDYLNHKIFYALLIFWISLLINALFSINFENSAFRAFGFVRFIILIFAIKYHMSLKNGFYQKIIFGVWFLIFLIVSVDLLFEFFFGFNTLGFNNDMYGRLSGFLNKELKIGNYYFGFILISISFVHYQFKNNSLFYICFLIFFIVSFLIGERANFIKIFFMGTLFYLFINDKFIYKKILIFISLICFFVSMISFNNHYKDRFYTQIFKTSGEKFSLTSYLKKSPYGAHYDAAMQVFKKNSLFGVGLKNFRVESPKPEYLNEDYIFWNRRASTHPHQIHLELLSETGIFGYSSFLILIIYFLFISINYQLINKNLYHLSSILFLFASLLPLIPTGSFFTSYGATIFWINFAIIESFNNKGFK